MTIFLCIWHVLKNWVEQLRAKMVDKEKYKSFFDSLYDMLFMKGTRREVEAAVKNFEQKCKAEKEPDAWTYFKDHYLPILGMCSRGKAAHTL